MKAQIRVTGAVQGVGYRPFVAELANEYHLDGEVKNSGGIVEIKVEGNGDTIHSFVEHLKTDAPEGSIVCDVEIRIIDADEPESLLGFSGFRIVKSSKDDEENSLAVFPPDIGICKECLKEMNDSGDRRFKYPLISCTSCGPRYSILKSLPYDRENITMDAYPMCADCKNEYLEGRRRHAQTISCHKCGPQYKLTDGTQGYEAIDRTVDILQKGGIVGLKGIGGYQLLCTPFNKDSVERLRFIKGRETKPFAIMFPNVESIEKYCIISECEREYLKSSARPIVLLDKKEKPEEVHALSENVCGKSMQIGAFLPNSGIHSMITDILGAIIVTSGNTSGEPMIVNDKVFAKKFGSLVDAIVYNDREILRPLDDSVLQTLSLDDGSTIPRFIRRSRGYVPLPAFLKNEMRTDTFYISFGADLKNTFCLGYRDRLIQSQFFGDMDELSIRTLQNNEIRAATEIFGIKKLGWNRLHVICDMHPGYASSADAEKYYQNLDLKTIGNYIAETDENKKLIKIQHHHAHIGSVMAEYGLKKCLGVAFDGTGYGDDGNIWGSEFFICNGAEYEREMHLKYVKMTGGDEAMKNAGLAATAYLYDAGINNAVLAEHEDKLVRSAISMGINTWNNCGMGRLFDSVACILGICNLNSYEGECASMLQNAAEKYVNRCRNNGVDVNSELFSLPMENREFDTASLIWDIYRKAKEKSAGEVAYIFHNTIADAVVRAAVKMRKKCGVNDIALSGGVFTNRLLLSLCTKFLKKQNFVIYYNRLFPTNDAGISAGQIYLDSLRED